MLFPPLANFYAKRRSAASRREVASPRQVDGRSRQVQIAITSTACILPFVALCLQCPGKPERDERVVLETQEADAAPIFKSVDVRAAPSDRVASVDRFFPRQHDDILVGAHNVEHAQPETVTSPIFAKNRPMSCLPT